jgi:pectate lyase
MVRFDINDTRRRDGNKLPNGITLLLTEEPAIDDDDDNDDDAIEVDERSTNFWMEEINEVTFAFNLVAAAALPPLPWVSATADVITLSYTTPWANITSYHIMLATRSTL